MHIFNRIKFSTPESVELEYTLAGIGSRAWAAFIDYMVLGLTLSIFLLLWTIFSVLISEFLTEVFGSSVGQWLVAIAFLSIFIIYTCYFVFFETMWQGRTPGKRFAKIRVVRDDGRPVGLQQAALRTLLRPLDEFSFIGAYLIMFNGREKRLGDFVAGTIVIQAQIAAKSSSLSVSESAKLYYSQLQKNADLSQLLPDDFAIIREYLLRRGGMSPKSRASLSLKLAKQVQSIINLEVLPAQVPSDVFLEAVYLAYQQPEF